MRTRTRDRRVEQGKILLLLLSLIAVTAATTQRNLQVANPCAAVPFADASRTNFRGDTYLRSSFFEDCVSSLNVNADNMLHFLKNTQATFRQYYSFYNIVNNPSASEPQSHQPELGYSIFGVGEGQVELDAKLTDLINQVETSGTATGRTFWDYRQIVNLLRDAHVSLPPYNPNSVAQPYLFRVFAERSLVEGGLGGSVSIDYDDAGVMQMSIAWRSSQAAPVQSTDQVTTLNGKSVRDFVVDLANSTSVSGLVYQSHGARVNQLVSDQNLAWPGLFLFVSSAAPSGILPKEFVVTYTSGASETYYSVIESLAVGPLQLHQQLVSSGLAELALNAPGQVYTTFREAVLGLSVPNASIPVGRRQRAAEKTTKPPHQDEHRRILQDSWEREQSSEQKQQRRTQYQFEQEFVNEDLSPSPYAAIRIEAGYAILKIESFLMFPIEVMTLWKELCAAAKPRGVTKLLIDISNNGGGIVQAGDALAVSLFPYTGHEWFAEAWDVKINEPMIVYNTSVQPIVDAFLNPELSLIELQRLAMNYTARDFARLQLIASTLTDFCLDTCELGLASDCDPTRCSFLQEELVPAVERFSTTPTAASLLRLIGTVAAAMDGFNPWTVVVPGGLIYRNESRPVNRGGVPSNLSNRFTFFTEFSYALVAANAFQSEHFFDEYVIVSNGAAGSTTSIFATKLLQIWKNRDQSGARASVTTVSYGGTNKPGDTTMAGFAASVQDTRIEYPLITDGLLVMLETLVPCDNCDSLKNVQAARREYESVLPVPGYFGETLIYLPVVNYYSKFMDPGALPMQYVKMPPDEHIPRIYTRTRISDSGDLAELYAQAATYFSNRGGIGESSSAAASWRSLVVAGGSLAVVTGMAFCFLL